MKHVHRSVTYFAIGEVAILHPFFFLFVQASGAVEYTDWPSAEGIRPPSWVSWGWGSSDAGDLENAEHPFIAIAPRFPLAQNGSTW